MLIIGKADNFASRTAELPLKWLDLLNWSMKMPLEKLFENVHVQMSAHKISSLAQAADALL